MGTMLAVEFSLDVSLSFCSLTTIQSLKRINSQEHIHFMRNVATRIEGKIDHGFQVGSFAM